MALRRGQRRRLRPARELLSARVRSHVNLLARGVGLHQRLCVAELPPERERRDAPWRVASAGGAPDPTHVLDAVARKVEEDDVPATTGARRLRGGSVCTTPQELSRLPLAVSRLHLARRAGSPSLARRGRCRRAPSKAPRGLREDSRSARRGGQTSTRGSAESASAVPARESRSSAVRRPSGEMAAWKVATSKSRPARSRRRSAFSSRRHDSMVLQKTSALGHTHLGSSRVLSGALGCLEATSAWGTGSARSSPSSASTLERGRIRDEPR